MFNRNSNNNDAPLNPSSAPNQIADGDELHNLNCYDYLKCISEALTRQAESNNSFASALQSYTDTKYPHYQALKPIIAIYRIFEEKPNYKAEVNYGDFYSGFLLSLEENMSALMEIYRNNNDNNLRLLIKTCINAVYSNPNQALERTALMISDVVKKTHETSNELTTAIQERLKPAKTSSSTNLHSPMSSGSTQGILLANMPLLDYKPQSITSIPSIRRYDYLDKQKNPATEYRVGTQAQVHDLENRVSPLFEAWLELQKETDAKKITHIYFNYLALDRPALSYEGKREKGFTQTLQKLEDAHSNVAVITLPADKGLFDVKLVSQHAKKVKVSAAYETIVGIALGKRQKNDIHDFAISENIKKILYSNDREEKIIHDLVSKTFSELGFYEGHRDKKTLISPAQEQALYFHFIKFTLTNYILETIKPASFNMSCKDGIDRGGASSAYYHLIKSLINKPPLSEDEFLRALHAAPVMVKGRGMNKHVIILWNAINNFIKHNPKLSPPWLKTWVEKNHPEKISRSQLIIDVEAYIDARKEEEKYKSIGGSLTGYDKDTKLKAAQDLLHLLDTPHVDITISETTHKAMRQGELGLFYDIAVDNGFIDERKIHYSKSNSKSPSMRK